MAASSSTAVAAPFPTALERKSVLLVYGSQTYAGTVLAVHHELKQASVLLQLKAKIPKRGFFVGVPVKLQPADGGGFWAGEIANPEEGDGQDSLYSCTRVQVPHEALGKLSDLANDSFLNIYPFQHKAQLHHSLPVQENWFEVAVSMDENNRLTDPMSKSKAKAKPKVFKLQVGVIGFGAIGRQVAETIADTKDVDLVAVVDDITVYEMVMAWKSSKFRIRSHGEKSLLFQRKTPELDKNDDITVTVFNAREHEKDPWGTLSVSYVIDTLNLFPEDNKRIAYSAHAWIVEPPEEEQLPEDNHTVYTMVYDDDKGVFNRFNLPIKYMRILLNAEECNEAMVESFPEWREGCLNLCFCAEADPTKRLCDPLMEVHSNDEEEAKEKGVEDRLISILSCFVRILRRATIGGVFLMI